MVLGPCPSHICSSLLAPAIASVLLRLPLVKLSQSTKLTQLLLNDSSLFKGRCVTSHAHSTSITSGIFCGWLTAATVALRWQHHQAKGWPLANRTTTYAGKSAAFPLVFHSFFTLFALFFPSFMTILLCLADIRWHFHIFVHLSLPWQLSIIAVGRRTITTLSNYGFICSAGASFPAPQLNFQQVFIKSWKSLCQHCVKSRFKRLRKAQVSQILICFRHKEIKEIVVGEKVLIILEIRNHTMDTLRRQRTCWETLN